MSEENHIEESSNPPPANDKFLGCGGCVWAAAAGLLFLCLLIALALLLPVVPAPREATRRMQCRNNLKQIGLAMHNYHDKYGSFPPAYTVDEQGKPTHSWRALILPFLEGYGHGKYDFSQPWDNPDNLAFAKNSPCNSYFCPTENRDDKEHFNTSYVMLVGPNAFADGTTPRKFADITDGTRNTIMVGEMSHSDILWTEPRDLNVSEMSFKINDPNQIGLRSEHSGGAHLLFADGAVQFRSNTSPEDITKALITINGGEDMSEFPEFDW
ncbi:MAG: DUF1559 domain-containing protein [Planctomycetes bacterium]|nr:DUF1559 domain-containing protein [Planctomycetota bacterium]MCG2684342.1 DUF1559 domain-containing protein [Planctomycetales bacterium]